MRVKELGQEKILIQISDTGIGIPDDKKKEIFRIHPVDSTTTRKFGGTGLGLAISKQIVNMMGGKIWVEDNKLAGKADFLYPAHTSCG